jgi:hypothetical protein
VAVDLELSRGEFLVPVLIRAVRAVGVQCGLDLDRLADASLAAEAVAHSWSTDADGVEPLRVRIVRTGRAMEIAFDFPARGDARRMREAPVANGVSALDALATVVRVEAMDGSSSRLVLSVRP